MSLDAVAATGRLRRIVLVSDEPDVATLIAQLGAAAGAVGPNVELALQLAGNCSLAALEASARGWPATEARLYRRSLC